MANGNMEKLAQLAQRLLARTDNGAIRWDATDHETKFATVMSKGSIVIGKLSTVASYRLEIRNDAGTTLEDVSVDARSEFDILPMSPAERDLKVVLPKLYDLARRQALGVDEALDSFLDELS